MSEEYDEFDWKNIKPKPDFEFCSFLMANEYDKCVARLIEKYLPENFFMHPFISGLVKMWMREVASGKEDTQFQKELKEYEREWFDEILIGAIKYNSTSLNAEQIAKDFIAEKWYRKFWIVRFIQKDLNEHGERDNTIINITILLKKLKSREWRYFEKIILERSNELKRIEID